MFNIGDIIVAKPNNSYDITKNGWTGKVIKINVDTGMIEVKSLANQEEFTVYADKFNLVTPNNTKEKTHMSNLTEKFVLALTSEPKKSFRKAGITNGDDILTDEGQRVFLTWLLHSKHGEEFKKEVVDGLLEEQEKNK